MRFMQTESVLQTKNRSGPAKIRFSVALDTRVPGDVTARCSKNAGELVSLKPWHMTSPVVFCRIKLAIAKTSMAW